VWCVHGCCVALLSELNRIFRSIQFTLQKVHNVCNDSAGEADRLQIQARRQADEAMPPAMHSSPHRVACLRLLLAHLCPLLSPRSPVSICAAVLSVCESARAQFAELAPVWQRIYESIQEENVEK